jgi:hypothetical protein
MDRPSTVYFQSGSLSDVGFRSGFPGTNFRFAPGYMERFKLLRDAANKLGQGRVFLVLLKMRDHK